MRRWEDVRMWRCEDVKMRRWEDVRMWRCEDVKMRRCEDARMWGCEDVKMSRWEGVRLRMWRWEDVKWKCEDVKMFDRPPLLEEPFAQPLSGKSHSYRCMLSRAVCFTHHISLYVCDCKSVVFHAPCVTLLTSNQLVGLCSLAFLCLDCCAACHGLFGR